MNIADFAHDVRRTLAEHLAPATVMFRGSVARGDCDEFSDVDIETHVHTALDAAFFRDLEAVLVGRYGPALVRYDPEFTSDVRAQDVRFSFRRLPIYRRLDLLVRSDRVADQKYPCPFPVWSVGTSALMNVVWALKHLHRGNPTAAADFLGAASEKLGVGRAGSTLDEAVSLLDVMGARDDVDEKLRLDTCEAVRALPV